MLSIPLDPTLLIVLGPLRQKECCSCRVISSGLVCYQSSPDFFIDYTGEVWRCDRIVRVGLRGLHIVGHGCARKELEKRIWLVLERERGRKKGERTIVKEK